MERSVVEFHLHIFHRVAGKNTVLHCFDNSLLHRLDVLFRNDTADDGILKDEALPLFVRLDLDPHMPVLAAAARLTHELPFRVDLLPDRLLVGHLGLADIRLDPELPLHPVDHDLEVQLPHSADDRLAGLFIGRHPQRRILLGKLLQRLSHLFLIRLGLRLDRDVDDRIRKGHLFKNDRIRLIAERISRARVLEPHGCDDVA